MSYFGSGFSSAMQGLHEKAGEIFAPKRMRQPAREQPLAYDEEIFDVGIGGVPFDERVAQMYAFIMSVATSSYSNMPKLAQQARQALNRAVTQATMQIDRFLNDSDVQTSRGMLSSNNEFVDIAQAIMDELGSSLVPLVRQCLETLGRNFSHFKKSTHGAVPGLIADLSQQQPSAAEIGQQRLAQQQRDSDMFWKRTEAEQKAQALRALGQPAPGRRPPTPFQNDDSDDDDN